GYNPPCITVEWWTVYRPFIFAGLWIVAWMASKARNRHGFAATGVTLLIGLTVSLSVASGFYSLYLNYWIPALSKPFLLRFYGANEWDFLRTLFLIYAAFEWLGQSEKVRDFLNQMMKRENRWFPYLLMISFVISCIVQWRHYTGIDSNGLGFPFPFFEYD